MFSGQPRWTLHFRSLVKLFLFRLPKLMWWLFVDLWLSRASSLHLKIPLQGKNYEIMWIIDIRTQQLFKHWNKTHTVKFYGTAWKRRNQQLYRHRNDPHHRNDLRHRSRNDPQSPPKWYRRSPPKWSPEYREWN